MLRKITEIENSITEQKQIIFLEKLNLEQVDKSKEAQKKITAAEKQIERLKAELKVTFEEIKKKQGFSQLRQEVKLAANQQNTIASMDGLFTIPIFLLIVKDICKLNESDLAKTFQRWCGKSLGQVFKTEKMDEIFKQISGDTIKNIFEKFIDDRDISKLTKQALHGLVKNIANSFFLSPMIKPLQARADQDVKNILLNFLYTEIFLHMLVGLYAEADRTQHLSLAQLIFKFGPVSEQYFRKPFLAINLTLDMVKIYKNTADLWDEVAMWIQGFYLRVYNMIPPVYKNQIGEVQKQANGFYPVTDSQDETLRDRKGITKFDIAKIQKETYEFFNQLVQAARKNLEELVLPPLPAKPQADERVFPIIEKVNLKKMDGSDGIVQTLEEGAFIQIVVVLPKKMEKLAIHLEEINKSKLATKRQIVDDSVMQSFLSQYTKDNLENKIHAVDFCFKKYELTAMQLKLLGFVPDEIKMHVGRFLNDKAKSWWGSSEHINNATELLCELENNDDYYDPVVLFQGLLALQKGLRKDDSSNLLPKVNLILLAMFDYIRLGSLVMRKMELLSVLKGPKEKSSLFGGLGVKKEDKSKMPAQALPIGVYVCEKNGFIYVVTNIEKSNAALAQHIKEINEIKVYGKFPVVDFNSIAKDFAQFQDVEREDKARRFLFCLDTFDLHPMQIDMLKFAFGEASIHYNKYLKEEKHLVWGWFYMFNPNQRRIHSEMVENQLSVLQSSDEKNVEPVKFLISLKDVMIKLYQDNSGNLLSKMLDIFADGFTHLSKIITLNNSEQLELEKDVKVLEFS